VKKPTKTKDRMSDVVQRDVLGRILWSRLKGFSTWFKAYAPAHTDSEVIEGIRSKYAETCNKVQIENLRRQFDAFMTGETRDRAYQQRGERSLQRDMNASPTDPPAERDQLTFLRNELRRLQLEIRGFHEESGSKTEFTNAIREEVKALEPLPLVRYEPPTSPQSDSPIVAVLKFSDWHIGAVIREEETEGFGHFNWETAQARVKHITGKFLDWISMHRTAFTINKVYVLCEGDFISGDIHRELSVTNEFPCPVQSVRAGNLLGHAIASIAPMFPEVHLVEVGGDNHGRLTPKPQFKQKASNNFLYVVYALANEMLSRHSNVLVEGGEGMKYVANIAGYRFLCEHGDTVKAWMGIPYYGMERERAREAHRRMQAKKQEIGFDYVSCGHWHVPSIIAGNILVNGSLSGTDEFDHGCGRHSPPSQVSFLVHPKHGVFNWTSWRPE